MSEFSIASWNVHMGLHNDYASSRDKRNTGPLNDVVAHCVALDADVLVLQEAWWWQANESDMVAQVAAATGATAHIYTSPSPVRRYPAKWTIAVLTRVPATRLVDAPIPAMSDHERALVRVRLDDGNVTIGGGHFDGIHSLRTKPGVWWKQYQNLAQLAQTHDVLVGDMNMWGPVVERNARPLRRAALGKTWPASRPHSQIDHVLVSERIDVIEAEVRADCGSDHLPIRAVLRVND